MKTRILFASAALLALAACGGTQPEPQPRTMAAYRGAQMPSVYALLGRRDELKLTSAQVTALDSIAQALSDSNRVLTGQMRGVTNSRGGGPMRRPRSTAQEDSVLPLLERVGENNRRAMDAIGQVLTPAQRDTLCAEQARQRQPFDERFGRGMGGRGPGGGGRPPMGGRGGDFPQRGFPRGMEEEEGDSLRSGPPVRRGWSFCPAPPPRSRPPADSAHAHGR
ncbi:MAG TPA: Spy/CpxP family protein refolding chaperone [Longimicrobium sp.]|nr:Spy/CpxP family protein refolding chaperone [Longimicrobium sp.]